MRWIFGIAFWIMCGVTVRVVSNIGYDFNNWQWWAINGSVFLSFFCGWMVEKFKKG